MLPGVRRAEDASVASGVDHIVICRAESEGMVIDMDRTPNIGEGRAAVGRFIDRKPAEIDRVGICRIDGEIHIVPTLGSATGAGRRELRPRRTSVGGLEHAEESTRRRITKARIKRRRRGTRDGEANTADICRRQPAAELRPARAPICRFIHAAARAAAEGERRIDVGRGLRINHQIGRWDAAAVEDQTPRGSAIGRAIDPAGDAVGAAGDIDLGCRR